MSWVLQGQKEFTRFKRRSFLHGGLECKDLRFDSVVRKPRNALRKEGAWVYLFFLEDGSCVMEDQLGTGKLDERKLQSFRFVKSSYFEFMVFHRI